MSTLPTLTIGIPAYNEALNIGYLLDSIVRQNQTNFILKEVIIVSDGSTDKTVEIAESYKKLLPLKIIAGETRLGKSARLNQIYQDFNSDLLVTFDSDVILSRSIEIENMVKELNKSPGTLVVGARFVPVEPHNLWGRFSAVSYLSFEGAAIKLNNGNNFYTLVGGATLMKKDFAKTVEYPDNTISDQNYLYGMAIKINERSYSLAHDTRILLRTVDTFHDWRLLGVRSIQTDKKNAQETLGSEMVKTYKMPFNLYAKSLVRWFIKDPIGTMGAFAMNVFIRLYPLDSFHPIRGLWAITLSAKKVIA